MQLNQNAIIRCVIGLNMNAPALEPAIERPEKESTWLSASKPFPSARARIHSHKNHEHQSHFMHSFWLGCLFFARPFSLAQSYKPFSLVARRYTAGKMSFIMHLIANYNCGIFCMNVFFLASSPDCIAPPVRVSAHFIFIRDGCRWTFFLLHSRMPVTYPVHLQAWQTIRIKIAPP